MGKAAPKQIQLAKDYRVSKVDAINWGVETRRKATRGRTAGKYGWHAYAWFGTLGQACYFVAREIADSEEADTLDRYATRLKEIGEDIEEKVNCAIRGDKKKGTLK